MGLLTLSGAQSPNVVDDSFNNSGNAIYDEYFFESAWYYSCTMAPTQIPTQMTTNPTTHRPTTHPTINPSKNPSFSPITSKPSLYPTIDPTVEPTVNPSLLPTVNPTFEPSESPTLSTLAPSDVPTLSPTKFPTVPTFVPSVMQTLVPSEIEIKNDTNEIAEVMVVEYGANNAIIWIIGIPIGVLFMSVFGVYLLWTYYEQYNDENAKQRKESEHVRASSKSQGTAGIDIQEDIEEDDDEDDDMNVLSEDQSLVSEINGIDDVDGALLDRHKMTDDGNEDNGEEHEDEKIEEDESDDLDDYDDDNQEDKPLKSGIDE